MEDGKRDRLIALGPEVLADVLLELSDWQKDVAHTVERLTSARDENVKRYRRALRGIQHRKWVSGARGTAAFARDLREILADLAAADPDPRAGVQAVADFYRADESIFDVCDDSYGNVGDVFCFEAVELFADYASRCQDKSWVMGVVIELNENDNYCVRESLFSGLANYLAEPDLREFVELLWKLAGEDSEGFWSLGGNPTVEVFARKLKDARLFERARRASRSDLSLRDYEEIAKVYHETGDSETALSWLRSNPDVISEIAGNNPDLMLAVHRKLGNRKEMAEAAWQLFHRHRSENSLAELIEIIGDDRREEVILGETKKILASDRFSSSDADFLIQAGRMDEGERYVLERAGQLNGEFYSSLLPMAEQMDQGGRPLVASVIYRSLLDSILDRAKSKYYHHGIRYLKKLDQLAEGISDWKGFPAHGQYTAGLSRDHGRKRSFWSGYGG